MRSEWPDTNGAERTSDIYFRSMEGDSQWNGIEVVSPDEWLIARTDLLAKEKEFTRLRDQLTAQRRALPWVKIEKPYVFEGPDGKQTLADLFAGRSQLIVKHFMLAPGQKESLRRLLVRSRPYRRHPGASGA